MSKELVDSYFNKRQELFDYFGYVENWKAIPVEDRTEYYWFLIGVEANDSVLFADKPEDLEDEGSENYYSDQIYSQRFLNKWVYRTKDFTMVCSDPCTDGNKFLSIFDNSKEVKPLVSYERKKENE